MSQEPLWNQEGEFQDRPNKKKKKGKKRLVYNVILILLIGIMGYSAYQIISQMLIYKQANDTYAKIQNSVVKVREWPSTAAADQSSAAPSSPAQTEPSQNSTDETKESPSDPSGTPLIPATEESKESEETQPAATEPVILAAPYMDLPLLDIDFDALIAMNSDVVGWLYGMENGWVNLPVVQTNNNSWYSHRLLDDTWNYAGTLFVDYRNHMLEDDITYIYGHHMKNDSMFGRLDEYYDQAVYDADPVFRFYTPDAVYDLLIVAAVPTNTGERLYMNFAGEEEFNEQMGIYLSRSPIKTNVEISYGDKFVFLYTCAFHVDNGRFLLICKAVRVL